MRYLILVSWSILSLATASAETYLVNPEGTGDFPTIQAAINAVVDGDIIELTDGTFTGAGNRDIEYLGKAITVQSQSGNPETCIIDCEGNASTPHRGFNFQSGEQQGSVLEGVTIINGYQEWAGGIQCRYGSSPRITNCTLLNNLASNSGGGMDCTTSSPEIQDCRFKDNAAANKGGGLKCSDYSSPAVAGCIFSGNEAATGGAFHSHSHCYPTLTDCIFRDNMAHQETSYGRGGAMGFTASSPAAINCLFSGNQAVDGTGGAVWTSTSYPTVFTNCTFEGNEAVYGGAIALYSSSPGFSGCTFSGNTATYGSGIYGWGGSGSFPTFENTIIAFGIDGSAVFPEQPGGATLTCCDLYGNAGGDWVGCIADQYGINGNISEDPLFCGDSNPGQPYTLTSGSPCLPGANPECGLIGAWPIGCPAACIDGEASAPLTLHLGAPQPNPSTLSTTVMYGIPADAAFARAVLDIYDPAGRLVCRLVDEPQPAGFHRATWTGMDATGQRAAAGIYFIRLAVGDERTTKRLILLR